MVEPVLVVENERLQNDAPKGSNTILQYIDQKTVNDGFLLECGNRKTEEQVQNPVERGKLRGLGSDYLRRKQTKLSGSQDDAQVGDYAQYKPYQSPGDVAR